MADKDDDKDKGAAEDEEQQNTGRPTLADIHEQALAALDEDSTDDDDSADDTADDDSAAADDDDASNDSSDDAAGSAADDTAASDANDDGGVTPPPKTDADDTAAADLKAPELEAEDIAKPGKYKAEFVDVDGNKYYVASVKDLPDDFEPKNQKAYGVAIEDLQERRQSYQADKHEYDQAVDRQERQKSVTTIKQQWAADEAELVKDGRLPKDDAERKKAQDAIYGVMTSELNNNGRVISFKDAYYRWNDTESQRIAQEATAKKAQEVAEAKKKRGAKVMGGGSGGGSKSTTNTNGSIVMEGKRPGTTLSNVHANVLAGYNN